MSQADAATPAKKNSTLKWVILFFLLLIIGGGGWVVWQFGWVDKLFHRDDAFSTEAPTGKTNSAVAQANLRTATLPPFLVNLSDPLGRRYIKLTVEVEVVAPEVVKELESQTPKVRDSLIMLLSSKTYSELATPDGKILLKNEILDRLNQILGSPKVARVFFTELVIQ